MAITWRMAATGWTLTAVASFLVACSLGLPSEASSAAVASFREAYPSAQGVEVDGWRNTGRCVAIRVAAAGGPVATVLYRPAEGNSDRKLILSTEANYFDLDYSDAELEQKCLEGV